MSFTLKKLLSPVLAASLLLPSLNAMAATSVVEDETPGGLAMATDLVVLRPVGAVLTAVGAVMFVVSLPFTAPTGGVKDAGKVLVADPAKFTFARCLGCTKTGYHHEDRE